VFDIKGKNVLITGATSGIGRAAALSLSNMGANISFIARNSEKADKLCKEIFDNTDKRPNSIIADMSSQEDIKKAAHKYIQLGIPLHVLLNNAGIMNSSRRETVDGFEEIFAVNHLAYYSLTALLLDKIKESAPSRIVNVSSGAHKFVKSMDFDDLQSEKTYKPFKVYGYSKLANILFTKKLASLLKNDSVTVNCLHPGFVSTSLGQQNDFPILLKILITPLAKLFARSGDKGAESSIYLCSSSEVSETTGEYFFNCKVEKTTQGARNEDDADRLWNVSSQLTGISL
tara:strand:+ start:176 stop:1036 length:861 start_codon:yes stop_codon:yes gene_type:complete